MSVVGSESWVVVDGRRTTLLHGRRFDFNLLKYSMYVYEPLHLCDIKLLGISPPPTPSDTPPSLRWLYDLQDTHDYMVHSFDNRQICSRK